MGFLNAGLTNGTTYYYVVSAVNLIGESANSPEASATPAVSTTSPLAPTGIIAISGDRQVVLSWTASAAALNYNIKRASTSSGPYTTLTNVTSTTFVDSSLTNGTAYYYVVSAVNSIGESTNSLEVTSTPNLAPPLILTAVAGNTQVTLSWSNTFDRFLAGYNVYRSADPQGPFTQRLNSPPITGQSYIDRSEERRVGK